MTDNIPPAGWYPTEVPGEQRWWDGQQWTEHRTAKAQPAPAPSLWGRANQYLSLGMGLSYTLLGALAIVFFIVGIVTERGSALSMGLFGLLGGAFGVLGALSLVEARSRSKTRDQTGRYDLQR